MRSTLFQHTATRRWLQITKFCLWLNVKFQHTATRRWLPASPAFVRLRVFVSTHSHPKVAAEFCAFLVRLNKFVSTHSHPKVAAVSRQNSLRQRSCFNTQPPEGGCPHAALLFPETYRFQHTATRRWLPLSLPTRAAKSGFQHTATRRWLHTAQIQMTLWR